MNDMSNEWKPGIKTICEYLADCFEIIVNTIT